MIWANCGISRKIFPVSWSCVVTPDIIGPLRCGQRIVSFEFYVLRVECWVKDVRCAAMCNKNGWLGVYLSVDSVLVAEILLTGFF
jgi:hypothetical protein